MIMAMVFPSSILSWLPIQSLQKTYNLVTTMRKNIKNIIKNRRIQMEKSNEDFADLLSLLMTAEHEGEKIPEELIIDESFTFLFAGHDVSQNSQLLNSSDNFFFSFQYNLLIMLQSRYSRKVKKRNFR